MELTHYLVQRGKRGLWQLRVPVPRRLQACLKKREQTRSLGTSDKALATQRALPVLTQWQADWAQTLNALTEISETLDPAALAESVRADLIEKLEAERRARPVDDASQDAEIARRQADLRRMIRRVHDGATDQFEGIANRMIESRGLSIARGSSQYSELVTGIADACIEALSLFTRRHSGEPDAVPRGKLSRTLSERVVHEARPGETIMELFERYAAQRLAEKRKRPDGVNQDRKKINQFMKFIGEKRSVHSIQRADILAYRSNLEQLPKKWNESKAYRGMTMQDAVAKARALNAPPLAKTTVNSYINALSALFDWMVEVGLADQNQCTGLLYRLPNRLLKKGLPSAAVT